MLPVNRIVKGLLFGMVAASPALADLDVAWWTIDSGGGASAAGQLHLAGTIGQPDAGTMSVGGLTLTGGYWSLAQGGAPPCPADLNGDFQVDLTDLATLLSNFGTASGATLAMGDTDGDGDIELNDLTLLLANFGVHC